MFLHVVLPLSLQNVNWQAQAARPRDVATTSHGAVTLTSRDLGINTLEKIRRVAKFGVNTSRLYRMHGDVVADRGQDVGLFEHETRCGGISAPPCVAAPDWNDARFEPRPFRLQQHLGKLEGLFFENAFNFNFAAHKVEVLQDILTYVSIFVAVALSVFGTSASLVSLSNARGQFTARNSVESDNLDSQPLRSDPVQGHHLETLTSCNMTTCSFYILAALSVLSVIVDATRSSFQLELLIQDFRTAESAYKKLGNHCKGMLGNVAVMTKYQPNLAKEIREGMTLLYEDWQSAVARSPEIPVTWKPEIRSARDKFRDEINKADKLISARADDRIKLLQKARKHMLLQTRSILRDFTVGPSPETMVVSRNIKMVKSSGDITVELSALRNGINEYKFAYGVASEYFAKQDRILLWLKTFLASLITVSGSFPKGSGGIWGAWLKAGATIGATSTVAILSAVRDHFQYNKLGPVFDQGAKEFDKADDRIEIFLRRFRDETQMTTVGNLRALVQYVETVFKEVPPSMPPVPEWAWLASIGERAKALETNIEKLKQTAAAAHRTQTLRQKALWREHENKFMRYAK